MKLKEHRVNMATATALMGALHRALQTIENDAALKNSVPSMHKYLLLTALKIVSGNPRVSAAEQSRNDLIKQYGTPEGGEGGVIRVHPSKMVLFSAAFVPIAKEEVKLKLPRLSVEIMASMPKGTSVDDLQIIDLMVEFEDTPEEAEPKEPAPGPQAVKVRRKQGIGKG